MIKGAGMMTEPDDPRWRKKTHPSFDDNDPFSDVRTDVCRFSQTRKTFSPSPSGFATRMRYPPPPACRATTNHHGGGGAKNSACCAAEDCSSTVATLLHTVPVDARRGIPNYVASLRLLQDYHCLVGRQK